MATPEELAALEQRGLIGADTAYGPPEFTESQDPESGDVTLGIANPLPADMTPVQAYQAMKAGRINRARAHAIATGAEQPQRMAWYGGDPEPSGTMMPTSPAEPAPAVASSRAAAPVGPAGVRLPGRNPRAVARERMAGMESAFGEQAEALGDVAEVEAGRARRREDYLTGHHEELARVEARNAGYEKERREAVDNARTEIEQATEDARYKIPPEERRHHQSILDSVFTNESQKNKARLALQQAQQVDPDAIFGGGAVGAAKHFVAAIAMGLGGFSAAMRGGPNHAATIIQRSIDRSVVAQRSAFDRNRKALVAKRGGFADMMARFKDERIAELGTRNRMIDDSARYIDKIATENGGAEILARAREMTAVLDQKKQANMAEIEDRAAAAAERRFAMREQLQASRARAGASMAPRVQGLEPTGVTDITKKDVEQAKKVWSSGRAAVSAIDRAIALREQHGAIIAPPIERAVAEATGVAGHVGMVPTAVAEEFNVLEQELVGVMGTVQDAGTLQGPEYERFLKVVGNIGSMRPGTLDRLKAVRSMIARRTDSSLEAHGYRRQRAEESAGPQGPTVAELEAEKGIQVD